jgi:NAD(P)-dependent dehydrogenase (short-subunit alcohol dehydrogenase family)
VKTVLITGSSSGIGKATAIRFARQGWRVAATMRNPEREEYPDIYPDIRSYALEIAAQYDAWQLENLSYPLPTEGTMAWITVNRCDDYR